MAVRVTGADVVTYPTATGWLVDGGFLHVIESGNGNVASFQANAWALVERVEVTGSKAQSVSVSASADPAAIANELAYQLRTK